MSLSTLQEADGVNKNGEPPNTLRDHWRFRRSYPDTERIRLVNAVCNANIVYSYVCFADQAEFSSKYFCFLS